METLILCLCLMVAVYCLIALLALTCLFVGRLPLRRQEVPAESEQERDTKKKMQEMQERYEQGFINLMNYDGSPVRKERDGR